MSNVHSLFPPDHEVFKGGRYLEALSYLEDIDHFELSILQYLGNKMPFDKGFIGKVAFPSVATISQHTKIPTSTVRKKIKSLIQKGYIVKNERRILNERGHWQQLSNDYILTNLPFEKAHDVIKSNRVIAAVRKRAVGQSEVGYSVPYHSDSPPIEDSEDGEYQSENDPLHSVATNSPLESPEEDPHQYPHSSSNDDKLSRRRSEVDRLAVCWEEVVKKAVSPFERKRFLQDYIRTRSNEISVMDKLQQIEQDPYLQARARSMNWLFNGFDIAKKNRQQIMVTFRTELKRANTIQEIDDVERQLPELIQAKSCGFISPEDDLIKSLFADDLNKARKRIGQLCDNDSSLPSNTQELLKRIERDLGGSLEGQTRQRLESIQSMSSSVSFAELLRLYVKHRGSK